VVGSVFGVAGKDYIIYLADARETDEPGAGRQISGAITVALPTGEYIAEYFSPVTGKTRAATRITGGSARISLPRFKEDCVVRVRRV
jgi:hypothetical protein